MLTERVVRDAKPRSSPHIIWDTRVRGLGLKVSPRGNRTYVIDYRTGGRQRRATIGRPSEITLADARQRAGAELDAIRNGGADPLERRRERQEAPSVEDALDRYFNEHVPTRVANGRMSPKTVTNYRSWAKHLYEHLGRRKVADVDRRHVERMVAGLPHTTRNRVLSFARSVFNTFERWELRPRNTNPVSHIERSTETARDRVLTSAELASLATALSKAEGRYPAAVAAIRFAAVTGLRIGEVLGIEWRHVDLESGRLVIANSKTGRRVHHLAAPARDILSRLLRMNAWCFTSGREAALTYRHVSVVFRMVAQAADLADVRVHDLRRTVMTRAAASGATAHILKELLGHATMEAATRYVRQIGALVREARERVAVQPVRCHLPPPAASVSDPSLFISSRTMSLKRLA